MKIVDYQGHRFHVREETADEYVLRESQYARFFREGGLSPDQRWLDVGAHIGKFTVLASPLVDYVVAVEPEPDNFHVLVDNISLNGLTNVTALQQAVVGDGESRTVDLAMAKSSMSHRLGTVRGRPTLKVTAVPIDTLVKVHDINAIKLDCEGTEAEILMALDLAPIRAIVCEWHFKYVPDPDWSKYYAVLKRLEQEGFTASAPRVKSGRWHASFTAVR